MKTVVVGGGAGCKAVLELVVQRRLAALSPEIIGVIDPNPDASGMIYARLQGWPTFADLAEALAQPDLQLVIEVTGIDGVREEIMRLVSDRVRVMDHDMARVFWDLDEMAHNLLVELELKTKLEADIREDRSRLQELLDSLPDAVMLLDSNGRIERVNRRFLEETGTALERIRGLSCHDMFCAGPDLDHDRQSCPWKRAIETEQPLTVIQQNSCFRRGCENEECWYQVTATPIWSGSDEADPGVLVTSREITEQIHLARETEEQARRARQILDTVHAIITIADLDGRYEFVNPRAERFFGLPASEFLGKTTAEVLRPDIAEVLSRNDGAVLARGDHVSHEEVFVLGGQERILITERVLLTDYKNEPVGICRISRDVTRSRIMHKELVASEKHAAVGKLAAGVAHELNNPLTGILTFSEELLEDLHKESPMRGDLELIIRETFRCRQIVRDLLDFSRQTKLKRQFVSVVEVVQRAIDLVYKQASFQAVTLDLLFDENRMVVHADPNQLQQVFLNMIINARDAMDGEGELRIETRERPRERRVEIVMHDEGCGIPQENMERIFEPFFSTKGDRGNGLGLAAVRSILEEHGGTVRVESSEGGGSTFTVILPAFPRSALEREGGRGMV